MIVIMGPQAVGKMTVGRALENKVDAKMLFNHETLDLYARFFGYGPQTFELSEETRFRLFETFAKNESNLVSGMIFTVVVAFDVEEDIQYLQRVTRIFKEAGGRTFLIELEADLDTRLERNTGPDRLAAKPSKRDVEFSRKELLHSHEKHQLNSFPGQVEMSVPDAYYLRICNTDLQPEETATLIHHFINDHEQQKTDA